MYNWFRRKFHTYEILLLSLFPNEPIARSQLMQHKVSKANQYKRQKKNNRQTIENLRVSNTQNSQIPSNNKRQKLTTFVPPINGNNVS